MKWLTNLFRRHRFDFNTLPHQDALMCSRECALIGERGCGKTYGLAYALVFHAIRAQCESNGHGKGLVLLPGEGMLKRILLPALQEVLCRQDLYSEYDRASNALTIWMSSNKPFSFFGWSSRARTTIQFDYARKNPVGIEPAPSLRNLDFAAIEEPDMLGREAAGKYWAYLKSRVKDSGAAMTVGSPDPTDSFLLTHFVIAPNVILERTSERCVQHAKASDNTYLNGWPAREAKHD